MAEYLSTDWPGCRQVFEIRRERRIGETVSVEVSYGITSLSREEADAARLLRLNRDHWAVENTLHHRRDVTLREDASRIRKGGAAQLMAALRNLILFVLAQGGGPKSLPAAVRHYVCHPEKALEFMSRRV